MKIYIKNPGLLGHMHSFFEFHHVQGLFVYELLDVHYHVLVYVLMSCCMYVSICRACWCTCCCCICPCVHVCNHSCRACWCMSSWREDHWLKDYSRSMHQHHQRHHHQVQSIKTAAVHHKHSQVYLHNRHTIHKVMGCRQEAHRSH